MSCNEACKGVSFVFGCDDAGSGDAVRFRLPKCEVDTEIVSSYLVVPLISAMMDVTGWLALLGRC